jgi:hypothetical protein
MSLVEFASIFVIWAFTFALLPTIFGLSTMLFIPMILAVLIFSIVLTFFISSSLWNRFKIFVEEEDK